MSAQQCLIETTDPERTPELTQVFPFTIEPVTYTMGGLMTIRRLIMQGTVYAMRENRADPGDYALYSSRGNMPSSSPTIRIGFDELGTGQARESRKALLLHECIHVMQDNRGATWMRVDTAEAAAYTAQCLFHRACGTVQGDLSGPVAAAWDAAELIQSRDNRTVTESEITGLLSEIRGHPTYTEDYSRTGRYDGIYRPPQPPPQQRSSGCSVSAFPSRSVPSQMLRLIGM